ncbi:MAG: hypothetical protein WCO53_05675 [Deltaproteobacteria bacterium]
MNLADMHLPRQLETDDLADTIRQMLISCATKLMPDGKLDVPVIQWSDPLKMALQKARLQGRIRLGLEAITEKLASEKYGIKNAHQSSGAVYGDRISRLLLFSNDGADRFYRHIEQLLEQNAPRLLGCKLNVDAGVLGELFLGKDKKIKIIMAEHKDVVSGVLRAIAACRNS